ncbi:MAG: isopentenyl-diphosphate Delta-isomerase [Nitrososphaeria archaeon]|jgi:isopentenyl-diphosphate delta-isomerase
MNENVILVNEKGKAIGTEEKMKAHQKGQLHRAFSIFIFSMNGDMLLQRRAEEKYHSGGLWTNACCSHPRPGENLEQATHRRLKEELGFDCKLKKRTHFIYKAKLDHGLTEHEFDHVFIGRYDGKISPNRDEVSDVRWVSLEALGEEVNKSPNEFTEWFKIAFAKFFGSFKKAIGE